MASASAALPALLGRPTGDLLLRIRGTHHDGRIVRLQSAKCTIGSGDRCTLRLRAPGIDPVHCLILRGSDRTVIRRWSPNTRLNGRAFQDAPLVPGDRLNIGCLEFEVITPAQAEQATQPTSLASTPNETHTTLVNRIAELERENRDLTRNMENHRQEWHAQRQQWEEERRAADGALANRWRQLEVVEAELEARSQQSESAGTVNEQQTAELEDLRKQIADEQRHAQEERDRWLQDRQAAEAELTARSERLGEEAARLAQHTADVEARRQEIEAATAELETRQQLSAESHRAASEAQGAEIDSHREHVAAERRRLEEGTNQLAARHREFEESQAKLARQSADIEKLQSELAAEREAWHATRDEAKERLAAQTKELDERTAELDRRQGQLEQEFSELAEQQADLQSRRAELRRQENEAAQATCDTVDAHDTSDSEATELDAEKARKRDEANDLMARLRELQAYRPEDDNTRPMVEEETAEELAAEAVAEKLAEEVAADEVPLPAERRRQPREPQPGVVHQESDEESIEDYMARLIHRMRGGSEESAPVRQTAAPKTETRQAQPVREKVAAEPQEEAPQKLAPSEYVPRSSAPEQSAHLSAMRELANLSARTAIGKHQKSRSSREASHMVIMAGASASLALVLLFLGLGNITLMIGAGLGLVFSGYCGWQAVVHAREARKEHDAHTAYTHADYESPHHKLWLKMLPTLERWQQKLEAKFASLKSKKK